MTKFWMSFADEHSFRGACIVEAPTFEEAIRSAWKNGCNPGGEVRALEIPGIYFVDPKDMYRLIGEQEAREWTMTLIQ